MTDEIRRVLIALTRETTNYLALTVQDINGLFPVFRMTPEGHDRLNASLLDA